MNSCCLVISNLPSGQLHLYSNATIYIRIHSSVAPRKNVSAPQRLVTCAFQPTIDLKSVSLEKIKHVKRFRLPTLVAHQKVKDHFAFLYLDFLWVIISTSTSRSLFELKMIFMALLFIGLPVVVAQRHNRLLNITSIYSVENWRKLYIR